MKPQVKARRSAHWPLRWFGVRADGCTISTPCWQGALDYALEIPGHEDRCLPCWLP